MMTVERYEELRTLPAGNPAMYQTWRSLLFLHFRCDPNEIQRLLPEGLEVDTFEGEAWVGLVPFLMEGVRFRGLPAIRGLSAFPETNVRTYVHRRGVPGVWFFSLDAANPVACSVARKLYALPYFDARMGVADDGERITYESVRNDMKTGATVTCSLGLGLPPSEPGSLEYFLIERYLLYSAKQGRLYKGRVHHAPYRLQTANLEGIEENLVARAGIAPREFEHVVYSPGVDVKVFRLSAAEAADQ
jgi:uncharacterized protein YqjF (DUF2071 family)